MGGGFREAVAWTAALTLAAAALALLQYRARDPDSVLYAQIAAETSARPLEGWIAPRWPPGWYMQGLYREHPPGIFLPAALLAKAGYPAEQAAYAVNALYQVLTLVLIQRLAASVVAPFEARALGWLLQLLPIAFTFRIRANQEAAVLLLIVAALVGAEKSRRRPWGAALLVTSLVGLALVKGVVGLLGLPVCALWLLARAGTPPRAWWGLLGAAAVVVAVAAGYEALYQRTTGEPFLSDYLTRQLGLAAAPRSPARFAQKAKNLIWYFGRVLWFPFPWSLAWVRAAWSRPRDPSLLFTMAVAALYVGLFTLSDRRADRYVYPVYYAVGAGGAVAALRALPRLRRVAQRLDHPAAPAVFFLLLFALHLWGGLLRIPTVKIWAPDS